MGKGWERASIEFNTRPDKMVRDISREDLFVPTVVDGGRLKLFALCAACGVIYPVVLASAAATAAGLYVFASWDFSRARRWAPDACLSRR